MWLGHALLGAVLSTTAMSAAACGGVAGMSAGVPGGPARTVAAGAAAGTHAQPRDPGGANDAAHMAAATAAAGHPTGGIQAAATRASPVGNSASAPGATAAQGAAATAGAYEGLPGLGPDAGAIRVPASALALTDPLPPTTANLTLGRDVYAQYCEACHGSDMRGHGPAAGNLSPGPADLRAPHLRHLAPGGLYWIVTHGLRGSGMPPWGEMLNARERWAVVDFVRANLPPEPAPDPRYPPASATPLRGAVALAEGQALYAEDCEACHGVNGQGMGPAGRYLDPRPADLTAAYVRAYSDAQLAGVIRDGVRATPMPAWGSLLTPAQRAYVVAYLRQLQKGAGGAARASPSDALPTASDALPTPGRLAGSQGTPRPPAWGPPRHRAEAAPTFGTAPSAPVTGLRRPSGVPGGAVHPRAAFAVATARRPAGARTTGDRAALQAAHVAGPAGSRCPTALTPSSRSVTGR